MLPLGRSRKRKLGHCRILLSSSFLVFAFIVPRGEGKSPHSPQVNTWAQPQSNTNTYYAQPDLTASTHSNSLNQGSGTSASNDSYSYTYVEGSSNGEGALNEGGTTRSVPSNYYYYDSVPYQNSYGGSPNCAYVRGKVRCYNRRVEAGGGGGHDHGGGDSYGAALGSSYGPPASGGYGGGGGGGWGEEEMEDGKGGDGLKSLLGLAGLLGLKGLKGLAPLKAGFKAAAGFSLLPLLPLLPILPVLLGLLPLLLPLLALLPLLLPILALLPLILFLFIPIPVVVTGGRGPLTNNETLTEMGDNPSLLSEISNAVTDTQCLERLSCELARFGRSVKLDKVITTITEKIPEDHFLRLKIKKGLRYGNVDPGKRSSNVDEKNVCSKFTCNFGAQQNKE